MKRPRNLFALILAGLHLSFCGLFFSMYFSSKDPQRALALVLFLPVDPWIVPLANVVKNEAAFAAVVTSVGTAQWWGIGWLLARLFGRIRRKMSNKVTSLDAG